MRTIGLEDVRKDEQNNKEFFATTLDLYIIYKCEENRIIFKPKINGCLILNL